MVIQRGARLIPGQREITQRAFKRGKEEKERKGEGAVRR